MSFWTFKIRRPFKPDFFIPTSITVVLILAGALSTAAANYSDRILRLSDRTSYGLGQIVPDLTEAQIIFVGEKHDNNTHHDIQLRIIRTLHNLNVPLAIGLEMFTARDQEALDRWVAGELNEDKFCLIFEENWGKTWPLYREIFLYARERKIPMAGLNVPKEITTQVAKEGFDSLSSPQLSQLPGVSCDVDDDYRDFIRFALGVHGSGLDESRFERFCEAQLVWDTTMAYRTVNYLSHNPGETMVVIAGNSHAWKPGIPSQLADFDPGLSYRVILPEVLLAQPRNRVSEDLADYLWLLEDQIEN